MNAERPRPSAIGSVRAHTALEARARLRTARARALDAPADFELPPERLNRRGLDNPGAIAHRSGLALASLASGDRDRDRAPATEELELSRRWDSPRALGVSLRVLGLAEGGAAGMDLARESVATLERSGARGGARARTRSKPA